MCCSKILNTPTDICNLDFDTFLETDFNVFTEESYSFEDIFNINEDIKTKTQEILPISPSINNIKPEIQANNQKKSIDEKEKKEKINSQSEIISSKSNKLMTREQFYKLRPKIPRISKADPRRSYSSFFSSAINSCDINILWDFLCDYCVSDTEFVQTWTGEDSYSNFPKYLKLNRIENIVEYLFKFILLIPDLLMELGNAKIYVRSDGISRLVSQISIDGTHPFDGDFSERVMLEPIQNSLSDFSHQSSSSPFSASIDGYTTNSDSESSCEYSEKSNEECHNNQSYPKVPSLYSSSHGEMIDNISDKVYDKLDTILSFFPPCPEAKRILTGSKRKFNEVVSNPSLYSSPSFPSFFSTSYIPSNPTNYNYNLFTPPPTKMMRRLPSSSKVIIHGLLTLHINKEFRITSIDISYSSQPFSL